MMVALPLETCTTAIEKAGNDELAVPSLTLITMFEYVAMSAAVGVPESLPVEVLNVAQAGLFWML